MHGQKNIKLHKHSNYFCFIYCLCFRCPAGLCDVLHSQRDECCCDQCACPSVSPSGFTAV